MNILLNDELTLSATPYQGNFYIKSVTGLGSADIRTSSFLFSGRHGGMITDQLYGFRDIAINGMIGNNTTTALEHRQNRTALLNALPIGSSIPVYITVFSGETYRIDCNVIDVKLEYRQRGHMSDFLIQLSAGDPYFYSTDGGDEQTATMSRILDSGGYVTPYILPVVWESGGAPTIVNNSGDANYYPVITLNDEALNPSITNGATGETFALELSMLDGDEIVIDMYNRTVTLNGADILGNKTDDSVWWALVPGDNPISLDTDVADDPVTATLTWRNGLAGI